MFNGAVAPFQGEPAFEGLNVEHHRFGLDWEPPVWAGDDGVPRSQLEWSGKRHLGSPPKARRKPPAKSPEESGVTGISDWIAARVGAHRELKPDGFAYGGQVGRRQVPTATFEPPELPMVQAGRRRDVAKAQPRSKARVANVGREPIQVVTRTPTASIRRPLPGRHRAPCSSGALHGQLAGRVPVVGRVLVVSVGPQASRGTAPGPPWPWVRRQPLPSRPRLRAGGGFEDCASALSRYLWSPGPRRPFARRRPRTTEVAP